MEEPQQIEWLVIRAEEADRWWLDEASAPVPRMPHESVSLLSPDALAELRALLDREYKAYGYEPGLLDRAFQIFVLREELPDGRLQLVPRPADRGVSPEICFGLPLVDPEDGGPFAELLEHLIQLRLHRLNSCGYTAVFDELDIEEDIRQQAGEQFVRGAPVHVEQELFAVLRWNPFGDAGGEDETGSASLPD